MGNSAAGGDCMGHGAGNCKEVGGDSMQGYMDKSSNLHDQSSSDQWTKADTFVDSFNSYTMKTTIKQDQVFTGESILGLNNLSIGGNANFNFAVGRNIQAHQGDVTAPAGGDGRSQAPKPKLRQVHVGAYNIVKDMQHQKTKKFLIQIDRMSSPNIDWTGPIRIFWLSTQCMLTVEDVESAGGVVSVPCVSSEYIDVAHQVFGELSFLDAPQRVPFSGRLVALEMESLNTLKRKRSAAAEPAGSEPAGSEPQPPEGGFSVFIVSNGNLRHVTPRNTNGDVWSSGWDATSMVRDGSDGVFILSNGKLWHVTPSKKEGELWSDDWDATGMVHDGSDGVFIVSRGNLRHVTPGNKNGDKWSSGWAATSIMVHDGSDGVFIESNGNLRHVTPSKREGELWSADWRLRFTFMLPERLRMVHDGSDGVFIVSNGNLWHVTPGSKNGDKWSSGWAATSMVRDGSDGVFIVSNGNLRHVTPSKKEGELWSADWNATGMVHDGSDGVFIVSRGNLRHVTPGNKDSKYWSGDWAPISMA